LDEKSQISHAAWDIGAYDLAKNLSDFLDAPLIASKISRLVYDCNRSPESGIGIPSKSELIEVPGNRDLTPLEISTRIKSVYEPFHELISQTIKNKQQPAIITIHSFTPIFFGKERTVELGILHDDDDRLAKAMMKCSKDHTQLRAEFNSPYGASDNVMHTINKHASDQGYINVMIEVKNDLLTNSKAISSVAKDLNNMIKESLKLS
jgi:predicted N-formylglutamate amidohydrolase